MVAELEAKSSELLVERGELVAPQDELGRGAGGSAASQGRDDRGTQPRIWATRDLMASVRDGRGHRSSATGGERTAEAMDGEQNGEGRLEKGRGGKQRVARSRRGGEGRDAGGRKLETERSSGVGRGTNRCRRPFPHARRRRRAASC